MCVNSTLILVAFVIGCNLRRVCVVFFVGQNKHKTGAVVSDC